MSEPDPTGGLPPEGDEDGLVAEALALATSLEEELASLEAALRRLEQGRYGRCEVCDGPVEDAVLEADPVAARCAAHAAG